ncbi:hypothetical protein C8J56DRAFT_1014831 [Mycena floridula]|nr:hypothetical protein C8J56DRAFT_1014831 [Mycena floridula]
MNGQGRRTGRPASPPNLAIPDSQPKRSRSRPPNLTVTQHKTDIELVAESPVIDLSDELNLSDDEDDEGSSGSSPLSSPFRNPSSNEDLDEDLAALEQLRKSVKKNLKLRPIRSVSALPKVNTANDPDYNDLASPASSTASSYFTPINDGPLSAKFLGSSASDSSSLPRTPSPRPSRSIEPAVLYERLCAPRRPLLIDTRPLPTHLQFHIQYSINLAIPSLILKRCRKPGGGFQNLDALRQFITTEDGKAHWDELLHPGGPWDGDVVIYDDDMDPKEKEDMTVTSWALISVIAPILTYGAVDYLEGGLSVAGHDPDLQTLVVTADDQKPSTNNRTGLFKLDTQQQFKPTNPVEIDHSLSAVSAHPPRSPLPLMSSVMSSGHHSSNVNIIDATPSPPPSQASFRRPPPPPQRRPSVPSLSRLVTKSAERLNANLPKLSVRTMPIKSATLGVPPPLSSVSLYPNPSSPSWLTPDGYENPADFLTPYFTPPHTPRTPKATSVGTSFDFSQLPPSPRTPRTARPDGPDSQPPTTEDATIKFAISTILPGFLYLGPELTLPEHVDELKELGVKRILNMAVECDADDHGLDLNSKDVFERYSKIAMRDTVEEENIARGVREVCEILDDARLHSAPTYVHCKAGKSRSVTAVMAYLIHANHWTLSQAYTFVLERRKGISPNIGFVSELMTFEETELGGKSVGVQPSAPAVPSNHNRHKDVSDNHHDGGTYANGAGYGNRRGHVRESLPPGFVGEAGPMSAGGILERIMGDSGQEMEIKDASGRYRHARRAPVDEQTLQPMRRVSKAGLESTSWAETQWT